MGSGIALLVSALIVFTLSATVRINTSNRIVYGQGFQATVNCDSVIIVTLTSQLDASTGIYHVNTLSISDLSTQLHDRTIKVQLVGNDGQTLNSPLSFSVATDGLTYTSTRSHVDYIDAFTKGSGAIAESGSSTIVFNNLLSEEASPIVSTAVKNVTLQSSGYGACSVPSNIKAVNLYIDAPYVQGSYIPELYPSSSLTDTFDAATTDNSNCTAITELTGTYSGDCQLVLRTHQTTPTSYPYGGALTTSSTPTTGGAATSQTPSAAVYTSSGLTVTFAQKMNYIGFWWSAGSYGNVVEFYRGTNLVATMKGDDVYTLLPKTSAQVTALNGITKYTDSNYFGHPLDTANMDITEPFVYFHTFAVNGFNFDKVVLYTTGNGFEYDNFTVAHLSGSQLTPKNSLVYVNGYTYSGN